VSTQSATARITPIIPPGRWAVDASHSSVEFAVKHMGIATVRGRFTEFEGTLEVGRDLASSRAYGNVNVASITTNDETRDAHLRSPDFFDADRFPEITFESTRIEGIDEESSQVFGNLTMHGVTREVKLEVVISGVEQDPWGNTRVGLEAVGYIMRSDFDMRFNQALGSGNMLVGDKVSVALDISAVKQPD
jgi:polyisoprenoid-binding protein YceI